MTFLRQQSIPGVLPLRQKQAQQIDEEAAWQQPIASWLQGYLKSLQSQAPDHSFFESDLQIFRVACAKMVPFHPETRIFWDKLRVACTCKLFFQAMVGSSVGGSAHKQNSHGDNPFLLLLLLLLLGFSTNRRKPSNSKPWAHR